MEAVAKQETNHKLNKVIASHNDVQWTVIAMNQAAVFLKVNPKLEENEITKNAVAVALTTMQKANVASMFIAGVAEMS
eukprot:4832968-Pyramimonas_sp.AAC.1